MNKGPETLTDFKDLLAAYHPDDNTTPHRLTRYERTKILGMRMEQLARGAPPLIDLPPPAQLSAVAVSASGEGGPAPVVRWIAEQELQQRRLPFVVQRKLPNGEKEMWRLADMEII
jgi:DNA-directed RNA polymerases I, II, and III subunit RPABC2